MKELGRFYYYVEYSKWNRESILQAILYDNLYCLCIFDVTLVMTTSCHGNAFSTTDPLWRVSFDRRWTNLTKEQFILFLA